MCSPGSWHLLRRHPAPSQKMKGDPSPGRLPFPSSLAYGMRVVSNPLAFRGKPCRIPWQNPGCECGNPHEHPPSVEPHDVQVRQVPEFTRVPPHNVHVSPIDTAAGSTGLSTTFADSVGVKS